MILDNPATIWVLIPLAAIGIAPFKMWLSVTEKQIEALRDHARIPVEDKAQCTPSSLFSRS